MRILSITLACVVWASLVGVAQKNDEATTAVRQTIERFFEGMKKSDTLMVQSVIATGTRLETVAKAKSGDISVRTESFAGFMKSIAKAPAGALDEQIQSYEIKVDGDLASAWTPYKFYYNGQFSHCGVNVFQLVRLAGKWQVWSIIDTRRREGCDSAK